MRQVALCAILNQAGCFVPAQSAVLPIFDGIFTRVGASDDLSRGMSTFMVEMTEAANILRYATRKSLVILDEVGRGTSSADGLAIAAAILENLALRVNCWTLFATHYHELVAYAEALATVHAMQTEVRELPGQGISFSHRLIDGACGRSFGIEVAKLAGIPEEVVQRAKSYLQDAAGNTQVPLAQRPAPTEYAGIPRYSPEEEHLQQLAVSLGRIEVDATTPIQALKILHDLKGAALSMQKISVDLNPNCT
jgi:DNA mismatch repair protein MutS